MRSAAISLRWLPCMSLYTAPRAQAEYRNFPFEPCTALYGPYVLDMANSYKMVASTWYASRKHKCGNNTKSGAALTVQPRGQLHACHANTDGKTAPG